MVGVPPGRLLEPEWGVTGALQALTDMGSGPWSPMDARRESLKEVGRENGAPDFGKRTFFRAVVDGQYKLVCWFSPE